MTEIEALEELVACADVEHMLGCLDEASLATQDTDTYHRIMRLKSLISYDLKALHDRLNHLTAPPPEAMPIILPPEGEDP